MAMEKPPGEDHQMEQEEKHRGLVELYEKMSRAVVEQMEKAGAISEEALDKSISESKEWAHRFKEHYAEDVAKVSEFIRRDWLEMARQQSEEARRKLDMQRLQSGVLGVVSRLAKAAGNQLASLAERLDEKHRYKTGEITAGGTLECDSCGQQMVFDKARRIPPCPKCHHTHFKRSV